MAQEIRRHFDIQHINLSDVLARLIKDGYRIVSVNQVTEFRDENSKSKSMCFVIVIESQDE